MIELTRLTYTYPSAPAPALREIDLVVPPGELWLLAGRSGSGKSTLLGVVNGLVPHFYGGRFAGRAVIAGLDTRRARPAELAGVVGTAFQEPGSRFVTASVADEIAFGMEAAGLPGPEIARRVDEIIGRLELGPLLERPLDRLSGGEQQRVAVAAALGRRPQILLLDEPTSQLDGHSAGAVLDWLVELREEFGLTTVVSEHRLARLLPRLDRLAYLTPEGRLDRAGPPADVLAAIPYGPPLVEAARLLGAPLPLGERALEVLRRRVQAAALHPLPEADGPPRLAGAGLSFAYNGVPALHDVSLHVGPGEVIAVLGRNGSGKTTLLRCLMGLLAFQAGETWLEGRPLRGRAVAETARSVAYVPQWPSALLFAESVRAELDFTLRNHGLLDRPPLAPETLLRQLDLGAVAGSYPRDLSSGERQRAALAAVLVTRPGVVLLDEPTLGMDPIAQARLGDLLDAWRAEGVATIVATHDVEFAAAHAQRAVVLEAGRIVAVGATAETLFGRPELRTELQRLTGRPRPASVAELGGGAPPAGG